MRILQVINSVDPVHGGPFEVIRQFGSLLQAGDSTEIASLDHPDAPCVRDAPFRVHAMGRVRGTYRYSKLWVPWLRANASNYDIVMVHGLWTYCSFGAWRALRGSATPYVVYTHGMLDPWFKRRYPLKHLKKWLYWPWAEYRVLRDASAVLYTCEEERRLARESFWLYRCNEAIAALGIASPEESEATRDAFFGRFPELRGKKLILFLSRIHPKKGCDLLIEAFAQHFAQRDGWQLIMAGPDQIGWRAELERRALDLGVGDRIAWVGMLSGDVKWGAYQAADVFILPSHSENFGIVVAEALACGLPVLISDKVNIWREIAESGAGIVAPDTPAGTGDLLKGWLEMAPEQKSLMRSRARACFETHFEINRTFALFSDFLERMIAAAKSAGT